MIWHISHRADPFARDIADRHYNRQKIGSPQFVPPGRCLVCRLHSTPVGGCVRAVNTSPPAAGAEPKRLLFLQGPPSRFWPELAGAFEAAGHRSFHINLCGGDWLYWRRRGATAYRGRFAGWRAYLDRYVERHGITHILYYADRLPYHRVAAEVAAARGLRAVAIEFGYLRPDWLTLERGGMGKSSHFPNDPATIRRIAAGAPDPDLSIRYPHDFATEAFNEVRFNLSMVFGRAFFPFYHSDKYYHPVIDYLTWLPRLARQSRNRAGAAAIVQDCATAPWPYFMVALQLQSDYQIRANSPYGHLSEMLDEVVGSFARHATADARLVVKIHPLDNGMENWPRHLARIAEAHGVPDRVLVLDGGDLAAVLGRARGCVLVNSTVGLHALRAGCPTKVLGIAVFDVPGLTHQGPLDAFWQAPEPVDPVLADAFVRAVATAIQIKGSFYNPEGRAAACRAIVRRIAEDTVNEPGAFVDPPPRLERARRLGIDG